MQDLRMQEHLGCWFHCSQAALKHANKLGLKKDYQNRDDIKDIMRLPLLPAAGIPTGLQEIRATICNDMDMVRQLQQMVTSVQRQWIDTGNVTTSIDLSDTSERREVCLIQPRAGVALVPCGHLQSTPKKHIWIRDSALISTSCDRENLQCFQSVCLCVRQRVCSAESATSR